MSENIFIKNSDGEIVRVISGVFIFVNPLRCMPLIDEEPPETVIEVCANLNCLKGTKDRICETGTTKQAHAVIDWLWQQISAYGKQFVDINDCPALHD